MLGFSFVKTPPTTYLLHYSGGRFDRPKPLSWEDRQLAWAVREPFVRRHSAASLVYGRVQEHDELVVESLMPEQGVIFSDGIENDYLEFNSGTIARIRVSEKAARLAVPQTRA